jgi:hypothetical protein
MLLVSSYPLMEMVDLPSTANPRFFEFSVSIFEKHCREPTSERANDN